MRNKCLVALPLGHWERNMQLSIIYGARLITSKLSNQIFRISRFQAHSTDASLLEPLRTRSISHERLGSVTSGSMLCALSKMTKKPKLFSSPTWTRYTVMLHSRSLRHLQLVTEERTDPFWKCTLVMTALRHIRRTIELIGEFERKKRSDEPTQWTRCALRCYDLIMSEEYSLLPWPLKVQQVEKSKLFATVVGSCPCQTTCLGQQHHSK